MTSNMIVTVAIATFEYRISIGRRQESPDISYIKLFYVFVKPYIIQNDNTPHYTSLQYLWRHANFTHAHVYSFIYYFFVHTYIPFHIANSFRFAFIIILKKTKYRFCFNSKKFSLKRRMLSFEQDSFFSIAQVSLASSPIFIRDPSRRLGPVRRED